MLNSVINETGDGFMQSLSVEEHGLPHGYVSLASLVGGNPRAINKCKVS